MLIWAPEEEGGWEPGGASRWWLHRSLASLDAELRRHGSRLVIRRGPSLEAIRGLIAETGADAVFWNRRYEPRAVERDRVLKAALRDDGIVAQSSNAALLFEPWHIHTGTGGPYQVFTPFWKACLASGEPPDPEPAPDRIAAPERWPAGVELDELGLDPDMAWTEGLAREWTPGEAGAGERLDAFREGALGEYAERRERPDVAGTSRLSPHLHHGEIGPRQVWHDLRGRGPGMEALKFFSELGWREFSHHLLYHFPATPEHPLKQAFEDFPWRSDEGDLRAWQQGRTGSPIVDAGMRQLWETGWMHNRVRMVAASFLVKDLLLPWQEGARWFWDTLVDADLANNTQGWQWTAGCGADAAPYFRVFNPELQAEKFDPDGTYVARWVEEPAEPIVDHDLARDRALSAYARIRS